MAKTKTKTSAQEVEHAVAEQVAAEQAAEVKVAAKPKENPLVAVGKQQLSDHPDKMEVFVSADGFGFFEKCDAENYARSLKDATIITVKR